MHHTSSPAGATTLEEAAVTEHCTPLTVTSPELTDVALRHVALPIERTSKSYATAVRETKVTAFKMTVRSKGEHVPDSIKQILKPNINPGETKVEVKILNYAIKGNIRNKEQRRNRSPGPRNQCKMRRRTRVSRTHKKETTANNHKRTRRHLNKQH